MQTLAQDVRYAFRMLAKNPRFAAVAVLTLALGIGANTAMFSFLDAVLLRPLPYAQPERLVLLWTTIPAKGAFISGTTPPDFCEWRSQSRSFEDIAAFQMGDANVSVAGRQAERVQLAHRGRNSFGRCDCGLLCSRAARGPRRSHGRASL